MKKAFFAVILTALVLLFFAACASKPAAVETEPETVPVEEVVTDAEAEAVAE